MFLGHSIRVVMDSQASFYRKRYATAVTSLRGGTAPGDTIQGVTPQ